MGLLTDGSASRLAFVLPIPAERRREAKALASILGVKRQEKEIEIGVVKPRLSK
jgi:hypothetical protein